MASTEPERAISITITSKTGNFRSPRWGVTKTTCVGWTASGSSRAAKCTSTAIVRGARACSFERGGDGAKSRRPCPALHPLHRRPHRGRPVRRLMLPKLPRRTHRVRRGSGGSMSKWGAAASPPLPTCSARPADLRAALERCAQIRRKWRLGFDSPARGRVEAEMREMQPEAAWRETLERRAAVQLIARKRMIHARQMNANLMAPAGAGNHRYEREGADMFQRFDHRGRGPAIVIAARGARDVSHSTAGVTDATVGVPRTAIDRPHGALAMSQVNCDHLPDVLRMVRDRRRDFAWLVDRAQCQRLVTPHDASVPNRVAHHRERFVCSRNNQRTRGSIVEPMDQATLQWLIAGNRRLRIGRHNRVHHSVAFVGAQRMAWDQPRLVYDEYCRVFIKGFDRQIGIRGDRRRRRSRDDIDVVSGPNEFAFTVATAVHINAAARDHFARCPARRGPSEPDKI